MDHAAQYQTDIDKLFAQWQAKPAGDGIDHATEGFVRDGVVCPDLWFSQQVRPLFLLKEAYGGGNWDLAADHLLTDEPMKNHRTWRRVTQWTRGILNTTAQELCPFDETVKKLPFGNEYLRRIAAINVKKSGGRSASNSEELRRYVEYDRSELKRQLELADPTVIVCGNTLPYLEIILDTKIKSNPIGDLAYTAQLNGHPVTVLDYWHPSNRYPDLMNYYGLMGIWQQVLG